LFATLNEMFGNRTICGIGRGDSAVRMINGAPVTLQALRESIEVIRALASGQQAEYKGNLLQFPWSEGSELPMWVAAYGPKALTLTGEVADGFIMQLADPDITAWAIAAVRKAAADAGRDPESVTICVAAPAYVTDGTAANLDHGRNQCRWFGGMVGNHVADIVKRYGPDTSGVPKPLVDYISGRTGYDYNSHGKAGNPHTEFVPDDVIDRFCIIGPVERQIERLQELRALGVDQFALYLQHDAKTETLNAYGDHVLPAVNPPKAAKA
jgi:probable F420-dependent oxidoreductase